MEGKEARVVAENLIDEGYPYGDEEGRYFYGPGATDLLPHLAGEGAGGEEALMLVIFIGMGLFACLLGMIGS